MPWRRVVSHPDSNNKDLTKNYAYIVVSPVLQPTVITPATTNGKQGSSVRIYTSVPESAIFPFLRADEALFCAWTIANYLGRHELAARQPSVIIIIV